ncbi:Nucleolar Complex 2 protein [Neophaeococcomyces mojaviensis]|uniref:Nucleolar Complex 2 protein n=1 Tax=Neophaeococcomyces mojaviensis TaxID=3383035 RepID=A0ACC3AGH5_9EURO|nr:Nucleolar Complex 2 protein [Knufia sp. JES_112]
MGKQTKATKKFERKHLKESIDRRKDFAKIKQRHQLKDKKKQRNAQKKVKEEAGQSGSDEDVSEKDDVNQDEYFREALPLPIAKTRTESPRLTTGKRKHEEPIKDSAESDDAESDDDMEVDGIDMAALAEKDPEFHKYLKENDPELLEFNEEDNLDDLELSEDEQERPAKKRRTSKNEPVSEELNVQMIRKWKASMQEQHSIRALKESVLAFRSAAHMDEDEAKDYKYTIPSSDVYHEVLVTALKEAPKVLNHHLPVKETASGKLRVPTDSAQFKKLSPLIRTFSTSLNHLLPNLSDSATLRLTLQALEPLLPYLLYFRKFLKQIIKSVASIWSDHSNDESTRITAFLLLRRLLTIGDPGLKETVLKSTYEHLIKASRNTTPHTLPGINLMKNSAAELWGIDQKIAYTTSFQFIRQAAMHLRTNIIKPTKESYKSIYNWQFIHSLDFFSRVLSTHCSPFLEAQSGAGPSQLRPLIYPVVQITLGVMRLIPTPTYFPLRFHLIRSLLRISQSTGTYIPLGAALLEVLNSSDLKKSAKPTTANLKPIDFSTNIRAPTAYLRTRSYQDSLGAELTELFSEFLALHCKSIAYPELALPLTINLKRWLKIASKNATGNKNGKLNQSLLLLVQKSEANARWISERRNKVAFTPRDRAEVEAFLKDVKWEDTPLGAFVVGQRKLREERAKTVIEGRRQEENKRKQRNEDEEASEDEIETV